MRILTLILLMAELVLSDPVFGQLQPGSAAASCTFSDSKQIVVRYHSTTPGKKKVPLPIGKVWSPSGSPMTLFTQNALWVHDRLIPVGAYSLYLIPGAKDWTLIVNKNVAANKNYDQKQDLLRVSMPTGTLSHPVGRLKIYFGHVAPKQCNMRIYVGEVGAWAEFKEK